MYDSKKASRAGKPPSRMGPSSQRNFTLMPRGNSEGPDFRSASRGNISTISTNTPGAAQAKLIEHSIGFQGLSHARVNLVSSSTIAARGTQALGDSFHGSTGVTTNPVSPISFLTTESDRYTPATGGSQQGPQSKKPKVKPLNMNKIASSQTNSMFYPHSTRASKGTSKNSLLSGAPQNPLLQTMKGGSSSGKMTFHNERQQSPGRTGMGSRGQTNTHMIPPRSSSNSMSANIGSSSMTHHDLSKQLRNKSPNQASPFQAAMAGSRQFQHKYGQQENSQRQLGTSLRQNKSSTLTGSQQKNRLSTEQFAKRDKGPSRPGSQKNQPSQRQITPASKSRDHSQSKYKEAISASIESLGSRSTESELSSGGGRHQDKFTKTMHEPYTSKFSEGREQKEEVKNRPSSLSGSAHPEHPNSRLQIKIPGGSLAETDSFGGFKSFTTRNAETGEGFQFFNRTPTHHSGTSSLQPGHKISIPNYDPTKCSIRRNGIVRAYAANTNQGIIRNYNEDRVSIILNIMQPAHRSKEEWPKCSFFGVYDGHGGAACADFLRDNLHQFVIKEDSFPSNPKQAIIDGFMAAQHHFLAGCERDNEIVEKSGSCAVVVLIVGERCYVANVGDSRAVLSENGGKLVTSLTRDHKPNDEVERKRIEQNGGQIYQTATATPKTSAINSLLSSDAFIQKDFIIGPPRVFPGRLSVCRTFGDPEAKLQKYGGNNLVVICTPEIIEFRLTKDHDFIVLASKPELPEGDGIFDKLSNQESIRCVWNSVSDRRAANVHQQSGLAVQYIIKNALVRRTLDNVTVVIIAFSNFKRLIFGKDVPKGEHGKEGRQKSISKLEGGAAGSHHINKTMHEFSNNNAPLKQRPPLGNSSGLYSQGGTGSNRTTLVTSSTPSSSAFHKAMGRDSSPGLASTYKQSTLNNSYGGTDERYSGAGITPTRSSQQGQRSLYKQI